jgi:hypothetical protein
MTWLWCIFAGFYLVAYSFWVPKIFSSLPLVILALFVTLALGSGLLFDGFSRAMQLQTGSSLRSLPMGRARRLLGGVVLLAYVSVYIPPGGWVVAHWPLDLGIAVVGGVIMIVYGIINK